MPKTIELTHSYNSPADKVWALLTDFDALAEVCKGLVRFEGLPSGRVHEGQKLEVGVSLFGKLPKQPYAMEVVRLDDVSRHLTSHESGAGVKSWKHTMDLHETRTGCILEEKIEIDAGLLTPLFAAWARFLYKSRHAPRLKLLREGR